MLATDVESAFDYIEPHLTLIASAIRPGFVVSEREVRSVRYFSPVEVAEKLGISTQTVVRMVHAGRLPAVRVGRQLRIPEDYADHLVAIETRS